MNFNLQYEGKNLYQVLFFVLPLGRNNVFASKKESLRFFCLYSTALHRHISYAFDMYILERKISGEENCLC